MKKALIVSLVLMLLGAAVLAGAYAKSGFDISKFSTDTFETKTYTADGNFTAINIDTRVSDLRFVKSEDGSVKAVCIEPGYIERTVAVEDGCLRISFKDRRKLLDNIGINYGSPKMTVCIPEGKYDSLAVLASTGDVSVPDGFSFGDIKIGTDTGDINLESSPSPESSLTHGTVHIVTDTGDIAISGITAQNIKLRSDTGDVIINSVSLTENFTRTTNTGDTAIDTLACKTFDSQGDSGEITLNGVLVSEYMNITRDTGDVVLNDSDAGSISITTDTGDVTGTLLSEKIFTAGSDTGDISVPRPSANTAPYAAGNSSDAPGTCTVTTDTGNITFTITDP